MKRIDLNLDPVRPRTLCLAGLGPSGAVRWAHPWEANGWFTGIAFDDDDIVIAGGFQGSMSLQSHRVDAPSGFPAVGMGSFVAKLSNSGRVRWLTKLEGSATIGPIVAGDQIIVAGRPIRATPMRGGGMSSIAPGSLVEALSLSGKRLWQRELVTHIGAMSKAAGGGVVLAGNFRGCLQAGGHRTCVREFGVFVVRLDKAGEVRETKSFNEDKRVRAVNQKGDVAVVDNNREIAQALVLGRDGIIRRWEGEGIRLSAVHPKGETWYFAGRADRRGRFGNVRFGPRSELFLVKATRSGHAIQVMTGRGRRSRYSLHVAGTKWWAPMDSRIWDVDGEGDSIVVAATTVDDKDGYQSVFVSKVKDATRSRVVHTLDPRLRGL